MQKIITIRLTNNDYKAVEEHLANYLNEGWEVESITATGGGGGAGADNGAYDWGYKICGWFAILLTK